MDIEGLAQSALCDVMEEALISRGIAPELARQLAKRACEPVVSKVVSGAKQTAKKAVRKTKKQLNYSKAFKKVQSKYKLKSGKWKQGGFAKAVKEAHKLAKKMK
tara:strand:- start:1095 stop:1406 length:312 start_codon:yes stop_codon:yes gene_type:complete